MELKHKAIPVVEIFGSIQGEGKRLLPATFVRFGNCNFSCPGFGCEVIAPDGTKLTTCDTARASSIKFKDTWKYYDNYKDLVSAIDPSLNQRLTKDGFKTDIVITGGEPLLYWKYKVFQDILGHYISRGHKVTIETNASLDIEFFREYQKQIMFSMSVKLSASGELKERRINMETITTILENCPDSYLKFVINPETWENDIIEIKEIFDELPIYADVYLMPLGANKEELNRNTTFVAEKCVEYGFGFSPRVHILAWDTKEAV